MSGPLAIELTFCQLNVLYSRPPRLELLSFEQNRVLDRLGVNSRAGYRSRRLSNLTPQFSADDFFPTLCMSFNVSNRVSNPKKQCDSSRHPSRRERSDYKQIRTTTHVRKRRNCQWHPRGQEFDPQTCAERPISRSAATSPPIRSRVNRPIPRLNYSIAAWRFRPFCSRCRIRDSMPRV